MIECRTGFAGADTSTGEHTEERGKCLNQVTKEATTVNGSDYFA